MNMRLVPATLIASTNKPVKVPPKEISRLSHSNSLLNVSLYVDIASSRLYNFYGWNW